MTTFYHTQPNRLSACYFVRRVLPLYDRPLNHCEQVIQALSVAQEYANGHSMLKAVEDAKNTLLTELNHIRQSESEIVESPFAVVAEIRHQVWRHIATAVLWCLSYPQDEKLVFVEASRCTAFAIADAKRSGVLYRELRLAQSIVLGEQPIPDGLSDTSVPERQNDITSIVEEPPTILSLSQMIVPVSPLTKVQEQAAPSSPTRLTRLLQQPPSIRRTQDVVSHIAQLFPTVPIVAPVEDPTLQHQLGNMSTDPGVVDKPPPA